MLQIKYKNKYTQHIQQYLKKRFILLILQNGIQIYFEDIVSNMTPRYVSNLLNINGDNCDPIYIEYKNVRGRDVNINTLIHITVDVPKNIHFSPVIDCYLQNQVSSIKLYFQIFKLFNSLQNELIKKLIEKQNLLNQPKLNKLILTNHLIYLIKLEQLVVMNIKNMQENKGKIINKQKKKIYQNNNKQKNQMSQIQ
ncbi:unnamed protein product [Paramecium sonneborni]|uniref:Uncharacterized protein n=1 Tax=Paramecium sonneborni TaxID=65129 RepID=A0A8S1RTL5_9CILI|nr:unnamed protein product [Paramecium sonneborni]